MGFRVFIEPLAIQDVHKAIDFYNERQPGLGEKFKLSISKHILSLEKNPFFRKRYDEVYCLPVNKYPYMIHYTIDEKSKMVIIRAVFHTSQNPETWRRR
jgi:toxin ParE1/3/4